MPQPSVFRLLGPPPCFRGFLRWGLAVLASFGAWHLHQLAPIPGLIAVGLAPFLNLYLFFQGLSLVSRTIPYAKTWLCARRLGIAPNWGNAAGGYLLVDEKAGIWIADGISGHLADLSALACRTDGQAFRLEFYTEPNAVPPLFRKARGLIPQKLPPQSLPVASVGLDNFASLKETGLRVHTAASAFSLKALPLTIRDEREEEALQSAASAGKNSQI